MIDISGHLRNHRQEIGYGDNVNYLTVNCCGYQKFITKNFTRARENGRLDYQIIYIIRGKGNFHINKNDIQVPEGNIVIYKPGDIQHYTYFYENTPEVYWIHFTGFGAEELLQKTFLSNNSVCYIGLSNTCIDLYKKIIRELQLKKNLFTISVNAAFMELLSQFGRRFTETDHSIGRKKDENIQKVIECMHTNYNLKWSINDFARQCNLSVYRFIHNFKDYTGMSPIEYLTKIKVDKARELLLDSSLNVSEISEVLGYDNSLYFSRVFRKLTGLSPSAYRKNSV